MNNKEIAIKLHDRCWEYIANQIEVDSEKDFDEIYKEILNLLINE